MAQSSLTSVVSVNVTRPRFDHARSTLLPQRAELQQVKVVELMDPGTFDPASRTRTFSDSRVFSQAFDVLKMPQTDVGIFRRNRLGSIPVREALK